MDRAHTEALAAKAEVVLARRDLPTYMHKVLGYETYRHHRVWADHLMDESIRKLILIAPPGSAKSTWTSVGFASWYVGRFPDKHVIILSDTATQAEKQSVAIRNLVEHSTQYHEVFPNISPDKSTGWGQDRWFIKRKRVGDQHPTLIASGVPGPILGARCDLMILDDVNSEDNTATALQRQKINRFIKKTGFSRWQTVKDSRCVVIMTRWHPEDLAGELLSDPSWTLIHMPSIGYWDGDYTHGAALCPEIMPREEIIDIKNDPKGGLLRFEGMYQGNPTIAEGSLIKRIWWKRLPLKDFPKPEQMDQLIQIWDTAQKTGQENDPCACMTMGQRGSNFYIFDVLNKKMEFPELLTTSRQYHKIYKPRVIVVEDKSSGTSLIQSLELAAPIIPVFRMPANEDKVSRTNAQTGYIQTGHVYLPTGNSPEEPEPEWVEPFISQAADFPNGSHDDMVDCLAHGLCFLTQEGAGGSAEQGGVYTATSMPTSYSRDAFADLPSSAGVRSLFDGI